VTYRPRKLWVRRSGGGLVETAAADSGDGGPATVAAADAGFKGRDDDDDGDDEGWIGIVAAALEHRTANCRALHISAHKDFPLPPYDTIQVKSSQFAFNKNKWQSHEFYTQDKK